MQDIRGLSEMEFGMIPIDDLATGEEFVGSQIPNPSRAVAQHDRLAGVHPLTLPCFGPECLAKEGRPPQVRDIRIVNGVRQRHDFARVRLARWLQRNLSKTQPTFNSFQPSSRI